LWSSINVARLDLLLIETATAGKLVTVSECTFRMDKNTPTNQPQKTVFAPALFLGTYSKTGQQYYQHSSTDLLIKVCDRKQPTALKPRKYVMHRTADGKFNFLTSLYPGNDPDTFTAEIARVYFTVNLSADNLTVSLKSKP